MKFWAGGITHLLSVIIPLNEEPDEVETPAEIGEVDKLLG